MNFLTIPIKHYLARIEQEIEQCRTSSIYKQNEKAIIELKQLLIYLQKESQILTNNLIEEVELFFEDSRPETEYITDMNLFACIDSLQHIFFNEMHRRIYEFIFNEFIDLSQEERQNMLMNNTAMMQFSLVLTNIKVKLIELPLNEDIWNE